MSNLPPGWTWATLEELLAVENRAITDGPFGSKLASRHYTSSGARVIRLQNIGDCIFNDEHAYISLDYFEELRAHEAHAGDLVVASLGDELPRACLIPELGEPAIVKADCIRVRIHPEVDTKWVLYALSAPQTRQYAASRIRGVGRPRLGLGEMRKLPVPLPPLDEQNRIAATLDDHLSRLNAARYELDKTAGRSARLHADIREFLLNPWSTEVTQLGLILREPLANGRSVQTNPHGFPVLRLTALRDGYLDLDERKSGEWTLEDAKPFLVRKGDFFISRGNGSLSRVGRGALLAVDPDPVAFPDTLIRARVNELHVLPDFLRLIWDSRGIRRQIEGAARTTAGIYKINQQIIEQLRIPVPSIQVQERIIAEFDAISSKILHARYAAVSSATRADKLRTSLLAEAFSGRLVRQDPSDEPASVLLDRIRAARAAQPRAGQRRGRAKHSRQKEMLL